MPTTESRQTDEHFVVCPLAKSQQVEWLYESRRGYGYLQWVPAVVVRVGRKKVTIDAELAAGGTKRVVVSPDRLRPDPAGRGHPGGT